MFVIFVTVRHFGFLKTPFLDAHQAFHGPALAVGESDQGVDSVPPVLGSS